MLLPANVPGNVVKDGPGARALTPIWEIWKKLQTPGFGEGMNQWKKQSIKKKTQSIV